MDYVMSFLFCGGVCVIAQVIYDRTVLTYGHITSFMVVIGAFLDFFHIYDILIEIFKAGALVPITSFGHSLMHGAMKATEQYGFFGLFMGVFDKTASGICAAIVFSFIIAIVFKPKS